MKKASSSPSNGSGRPTRSSERPDVGFLDSKVVLITGGTGSLGKRFTETVLKHSKVRKLIIFSRDELKQSEMANAIADERIRFFIGDVRDLQRLQRAFHGVDYVVHAAALKQVPTLEYNPFEAVLTNIIGAQNVINAAIDQGVERVIALSTDKAVNPINLYGATKLCAEKLFIAGNSYASALRTHFSVVRYGNVVGSRGSVIPSFLEKKKTGFLPITDLRMTRFWITLDSSVQLVLAGLQKMHGGEIFVPRIPSMRIVDLAKAIAPGCRIKTVGVRPGEKIHETLLTEDESSRAVEIDGYFVIRPLYRWWPDGHKEGKPLPAGFRYSSDSNTEWLTLGQIAKLANETAASSNG